MLYFKGILVVLLISIQIACSSSNPVAPNSNNNGNDNNNPNLLGQGGGNVNPPTPSPTPSQNANNLGLGANEAEEMTIQPGNYMLLLKFANNDHKLETVKLVAIEMDIPMLTAKELVDGVNQNGDLLVVMDCVSEESAKKVNHKFVQMEANTEIKMNPRCIDPAIKYEVSLHSFKELGMEDLIGEVGKQLRLNSRQVSERLIRDANPEHPLMIQECLSFINADGLTKRLSNMGAGIKMTESENCN